MGSNGEDDVWCRYDRVCQDLNLDRQSLDAAWTSYKDINNDYVLEGDHLEWLGCALYIAGQSCTLETVEGGRSSGNKVSLSQILKATKLNLIEFFKKIQKWLEMAKLPQSFQSKVEALERKFEVASIIFDKYCRVFCDLFQLPDERQLPERKQRGRKGYKNRPCSPYDVFKFGWTLYIHIKSQYPQINDDLVNSHHLLLCCMDMLFSAALKGKRRDLLNPDCPFLPEDFGSVDFTPPLQMPCILSELCLKYGAIEKECRVIRDYYWRGPVKRLFEMEVLNPRHSPSDVDTMFVCMLTPANFYSNDKALNREYELNMLTQGDFDERVFLHRNASEEIGTPTKHIGLAGSMPTQTPPPHYLQLGTPLMGREHLIAKDNKLTPVSDATHSVTQLHLLLDSRAPEPSDELKQVCTSCMISPLAEIEHRVREFSERFLQGVPTTSVSQEESGPAPDSFVKLRLRLSTSLYYKLLDAIVVDEEKRNADFGQLQTMLEYELFHKALFALCTEIVLFSYNSQSRAFPWVLEAFAVSAFHFYKLIEVVIKVEGNFPRGIIKHLNRVEETVLGQLAWRSNSPLFEAIDAAGSVPSYDDVALPTPPGGRGGASPLLHPRLRTLGGKVESPLSSLLARTDRTSSPSAARRQLFSGGQKRTPTKLIPIAPKPPQGGVTITPIKISPGLLLQQLQQQQAQISQQLQAAQTQQQPSATQAPNLAQLVSSPTVQQLTPASVASTGTQTTPVRSVVPPSMKPPSIFLSPPKTAGILSPPTVTITTSPILSSTPSPMKTPLRGSLPVTPATLTQASPPRPKRTGSLALFYRKVYQLAYIRIKDLCERLGLERDIMQKVWTCFEHSMMKSPDILRDRHIDQLIMCSVYVLSKVLRLDVTFQEIMRQYRHQPQAKSHVYRSVLLNNGPRKKPHPDTSSPALGAGEGHMGETDQSASEEPGLKETPLDHLLYRADIPVNTRGDIIQFYNKLFIGFVKDYALRFSPNESEGNTPSLSPLPVIRKATLSPRKVSRHHQIFISPHKGNLLPLSPLAKTFVIQKSPPSHLQDLNEAVNAPKVGAKRHLDLLSASPMSPAKRAHIQVTKLPGSQRKTGSLMQQLMSVASDRASVKSQAAPGSTVQESSQ